MIRRDYMANYETKEKLLKLSENFLQKARDANCFFDISKQFKKNRSERYDEMSISSAFYSYTDNAITVAVIMELSKLYDTSKQSINIKKFLDICYENRGLFPQQKELTLKKYGTEDKMILPYTRTVSTDEKDFFKNEIDNLSELESLIINGDNPLRVEMTIDRYFQLFYWKYDNLKTKIDYLIKQRNKVYAHNDEDKLFIIDEIIDKYPLHYNDAESLISYALEVISFTIAMLTGVNIAELPNNIDDWTYTLDLVGDGLKYQKEKFEEEFGEGSFLK